MGRRTAEISQRNAVALIETLSPLLFEQIDGDIQLLGVHEVGDDAAGIAAHLFDHPRQVRIGGDGAVTFPERCLLSPHVGIPPIQCTRIRGVGVEGVHDERDTPGIDDQVIHIEEHPLALATGPHDQAGQWRRVSAAADDDCVGLINQRADAVVLAGPEEAGGNHATFQGQGLDHVVDAIPEGAVVRLIIQIGNASFPFQEGLHPITERYSPRITVNDRGNTQLNHQALRASMKSTTLSRVCSQLVARPASARFCARRERF